MSSIPTLPGITSTMVATPRLRIHVLQSGPANGIPVVFIHGNASSATFWEETMLALPEGYRGIAPDLRGYGDTENLRIDATKGVCGWVDDILGLVEAMHLPHFHVVGHSLGGAVVFGLLASRSSALRSVTLAAPGSPYGFGGSRDLDGRPCWPDAAGSGGGGVNPEFARLLGEKNRGSDNPQASPRVVMNTFYWKPPFVPAREEALLSSVLSEHVGPEAYPGDAVPSPNWPGMGPGVYGPVNALSPKYAGTVAERVVSTVKKPPVLWIRGDSDQIVSDNSLFDLGMLGKLGFVPGWPGDDLHPPQPMVGQVRNVLERYAAAGGEFQELVFPDTGHTPYIEKPEAFNTALHALLRAN